MGDYSAVNSKMYREVERALKSKGWVEIGNREVQCKIVMTRFLEFDEDGKRIKR